MKVAVTGAGPAGLAFLKELKETGSDAVCFEATHRSGGVSAPPHVVRRRVVAERPRYTPKTNPLAGR